MEQKIESQYATLVAIGLFLTTIVVVAGPVSEPVNAPKLLVMVTFAFASITYLFFAKNKLQREIYQWIVFPASLFIFLAFIASLISESPFSQNFYGIYGRNTGLLSIFGCVFFFVVIALFKECKSIEKIYYSLFSAGIVNIIYGLVVEFIGDPIPWFNNYGALLGTFGNPNFSGSFYGMISVVFLSLCVKNFSNKVYVLIYFIGYALSLYCVLLTKTTQGILVVAITNSIFLTIFVAKKLRNMIVTLSLFFFIMVSGLIVLFGIFQKGPLDKYLYQRSVSLRGVYWDAAINAGMAHPVSGVGLDAFGDWYRRTRSLKAATWFPGPETITNAAHNYYLDIFASGGILLFISYSIFTAIAIYSVFSILRDLKEFDYLGGALIALFIGFQAQALISIPQIGLAIWGWVLTAMLFSYSRTLASVNTSKNDEKALRKKKLNPPVGVTMFLGMSIGFVLSIPPYSADAKYTSALRSGDLVKVEAALSPGYFSPSNSERLAQAVITLEQNKLYAEARKFALIGVKFNPDSFNAWKVLYYISNSSNSEKRLALTNMKRLDPKNKNLSSLEK